jgi:hypothetical protein
MAVIIVIVVIVVIVEPPRVRSPRGRKILVRPAGKEVPNRGRPAEVAGRRATEAWAWPAALPS